MSWVVEKHGPSRRHFHGRGADGASGMSVVEKHGPSRRHFHGSSKSPHDFGIFRPRLRAVPLP